VREEIAELIEINEKSELVSQLDNYISTPRSVKNKLFTNIGICLTYNCQLRCNYCSFASGEGKGGSLSIADAMAFVTKTMKDIVVNKLLTRKQPRLHLVFTGGGEPTYDWSLFESVVTQTVIKAQRNNIEYDIELTTNGILSSKQIDFISSNVARVMLSFDGMPDAQNKNRRTADGADTFEILDRTIHAFNARGVPLYIRSTVWQPDFMHFRKMAEFLCENYEFADWSVMPAMPQGRAFVNTRDEYYHLDDFDFLRYYLDALRFIKAKYPRRRLSTPIFPNGETAFFCGALFTMCPWLLPSGKIVSCLEANGQLANIGQVTDGKVEYYDTYEDVLSPVVRRLFDDCADCLAFRFCRGNCPLEAMQKSDTDRMFRKWTCSQIRKYYEFIFSEILSGKKCFGWSVEPLIDHPEFAEYGVAVLKPPEIGAANALDD
jgi:radical SAM protein with 4Fe4S-binding SPASM domain